MNNINNGSAPPQLPQSINNTINPNAKKKRKNKKKKNK